MIIASVAELDEVLSRPTAGDAAAMREMPGPLLIAGVGGKMGPTLARRAVRAAREAGVERRVIGVSRFSGAGLREKLEQWGVETVAADLLDAAQVAALPDAACVLFMSGRKFGSTGNESMTWAMNALAPALVAERFGNSKIVAFSSGNVYPLVPVAGGGAVETTPPGPVGEYAQSVLARERVFEYFSGKYSTPVALLRLNYAVELRYGVLLDIGRKVFAREPVDLRMGSVNVIWQGDANSAALRAFSIASSPPVVLNLTGPETLSVRRVAERFGGIFGIAPVFDGEEGGTALLNNAARCHRLFGYPQVTVEEIIEWTAHWISMGGATLDKPTHFEVRDGKF